MDDLIQKEIEEFRKKFVLSMNKTFFGNPEELKKQGWEVGKDHFIIRQDTTPEEIEQFLTSSLQKIRDEAKREAIGKVRDFVHEDVKKYHPEALGDLYINGKMVEKAKEL